MNDASIWNLINFWLFIASVWSLVVSILSLIKSKQNQSDISRIENSILLINTEIQKIESNLSIVNNSGTAYQASWDIKVWSDNNTVIESGDCLRDSIRYLYYILQKEDKFSARVILVDSEQWEKSHLDTWFFLLSKEWAYHMMKKYWFSNLTKKK